MRKHVFLVTDTVYAHNGSAGEITGVDQLNLLADGAVALMSNEGVVIADGASPTLTKDVNIYVGGQHHTGAFVPSGIAEMVKQPYVAPVKKVLDIGSNGTDGDLAWSTGFLDLTSAGVMIQTASHETGDNRWRRYDLALKSSMSESDAIDALVAKINADSTCPATASKTTETTNFGIRLTSKDGRNFVASCTGELGDSEIRITTAHNPGIGTQELVQAEYDENSTIIGARDGNKANKVFSGRTVPAGTYVTYALTYRHERNTMTEASNPLRKEALFMVPTTSTDVIADMDGILASINAA